jgi:hypothetical protein
VHQIDISYNFKLQCESSDLALRQYVNGKRSDIRANQVLSSNTSMLICEIILLLRVHVHMRSGIFTVVNIKTGSPESEVR